MASNKKVVKKKSLLQIAIERGEDCHHWIGRYHLMLALHEDAKNESERANLYEEVFLSLEVVKPMIKEFKTSIESILDSKNELDQSLRIKLRTAAEMARLHKASFSEIWPEILAVLQSMKRLTTSSIPTKYRSRPMAKSEAIHFIPWPIHCDGDERKVRDWFSGCMDDKTYPYEELSKKSFVFDIRAFPKENQAEMK